jgi:hypothetical protein
MKPMNTMLELSKDEPSMQNEEAEDNLTNILLREGRKKRSS